MPPIKASQALDWGRLPDSFEHHGIKGQHWGEKHGPPYPLKPEVSAKVSNKDSNRKGDMADNIFAAVGLAMLASSIVSPIIKKIKYNKSDNATHKKTVERRKNEKIDPKTGLYLLNSKETADESMANINPHVNLDRGFGSNCTLCTLSMELRARGYDVVAGKLEEGLTTKDLERLYPNTKSITEPPKNKLFTKDGDLNVNDPDIWKLLWNGDDSNINKIVNEIETTQKEGARGDLSIYFVGGGAHSMHYQVHNGKVEIYDAQHNKKRSLNDFKGLTYAAEYFETDNAQIDIDYCKKMNYIE